MVESVTLRAAGLGGREIAALRHILHRHVIPVPGVDRLRLYEIRELHQKLAPELATSVGKPPLLLRRIAESLALGVNVELLPDYLVWALHCCRRFAPRNLKEVVDYTLLTPVHTARQNCQKE